MQQLTCCQCGDMWQRPTKTGRKPKTCPTCSGENTRPETAGCDEVGDLKVCCDCGASFPRDAKKRRQPNACPECCKARNKRIEEMRQCAKPSRSCVVCGSIFRSTVPSQITCPPTEAERARKKDQSKAQSWCARSLYGYQLGEVRDLKRQQPGQFRCVSCNRLCVPGVDGVHITARKFCNRRECKARYHAQLRRHGLNPDHWFVKSGPASLIRRRPNARRFISTQCPECGKFFLKRDSRHRAKYCCKRCKRRTVNRTRRARLRTNWVETVHLHKVAVRDSFICAICNEKVDMTLDCNHDFAGSVDHIVPLVLGGFHSYANAQFAHRICNSAKGALEGRIAMTSMSSKPEECCRWVSKGLQSWLSNPDSLSGIIKGVGANPD